MQTPPPAPQGHLLKLCGPHLHLQPISVPPPPVPPPIPSLPPQNPWEDFLALLPKAILSPGSAVVTPGRPEGRPGRVAGPSVLGVWINSSSAQSPSGWPRARPRVWGWGVSLGVTSVWGKGTHSRHSAGPLHSPSPPRVLELGGPDSKPDPSLSCGPPPTEDTACLQILA